MLLIIESFMYREKLNFHTIKLYRNDGKLSALNSAKLISAFLAPFPSNLLILLKSSRFCIIKKLCRTEVQLIINRHFYQFNPKIWNFPFICNPWIFGKMKIWVFHLRQCRMNFTSLPCPSQQVQKLQTSIIKTPKMLLSYFFPITLNSCWSDDVSLCFLYFMNIICASQW